MVTRKQAVPTEKPAKTSKSTGSTVAKNHGLHRSVATMPDAREHLVFIDKAMHEASEKSISAVESSLPLVSKASTMCAELSMRMSDSDIAQHPLLQDAISIMGELASTQEVLRENLMHIMEAQEFRDVAGQVVNKIVAATQEVETTLISQLPKNLAPQAAQSFIKSEGLTSGPAVQSSPDGVKGQDEVDDLMSSLGF